MNNYNIDFDDALAQNNELNDVDKKYYIVSKKNNILSRKIVSAKNGNEAIEKYTKIKNQDDLLYCVNISSPKFLDRLRMNAKSCSRMMLKTESPDGKLICTEDKTIDHEKNLFAVPVYFGRTRGCIIKVRAASKKEARAKALMQLFIDYDVEEVPLIKEIIYINEINQSTITFDDCCTRKSLVKYIDDFICTNLE